MERFKNLLPGIAEIKPVTEKDETVCWEAYDASGTLLGYAFSMDIPESTSIPGMEEMDRYVVTGVLDPKEYSITGLEISLHPEGPDEPWTIEVTEAAFRDQYIGLRVEEIDLAPDGKIDAIADATLSSGWITQGIRDKVTEIIRRTKN